MPTESTSDSREKSFVTSGMAIVWAIALANLLLHIYFNNRYGYFRDEFDYMSCGDHLGWGYVDQPPLIPFLIRICRAVLGDSLRSIRFIPALASSLLIVQTGAFARELGARRWAVLLSAIAVLTAPQYVSNGGLLGTNCLEPLLWTGCAYCLVLTIKRNDFRYWLWFGVIAGLGLEEKYSIAIFGAGIVVGLLLTEHRRVFAGKWIWLGGAAAFFIFLPNLLWNIHYDWPFLQLMRSIRAEGRDVLLGPVDFFLQQVLVVSPVNALLWLPGLFALLFSARLRPYRALGWSYVVTYAAFFVLHGKNYYLSPIYPMLIAAGALTIQNAWEPPASAAPRMPWWKPFTIAVLLANGVYLAPIAVPVLSPEHFLEYAKNLPIKLPVNEHSHTRAALPQWYSDQFGWKEIADAAAVAWNRIPPDERKDCGIFAQDYGQAGAIDFFGRSQGLPPAISGDRTYYLWGPRGHSGNCLIVLDDSRAKLETLFEHVEYVTTSADNQWALTRQVPVYLCRGARFGTLAQIWSKVKRWR